MTQPEEIQHPSRPPQADHESGAAATICSARDERSPDPKLRRVWEGARRTAGRVPHR